MGCVNIVYSLFRVRIRSRNWTSKKQKWTICCLPLHWLHTFVTLNSFKNDYLTILGWFIIARTLTSFKDICRSDAPNSNILISLIITSWSSSLRRYKTAVPNAPGNEIFIGELHKYKNIYCYFNMFRWTWGVTHSFQASECHAPNF